MADGKNAEDQLTTAIGRVVRSSAWAVMALEMIGSALTGEDDYFGTHYANKRETRTYVDETMHEQLDLVSRELAAAPETAWTEHAREAVAELDELRPYRNRVVHDSWSVMATEDDPLAAWASRASIFGSVVKTSVRSLWHLDRLLGWVAPSLQHTADAIRAHEALARLDEEEQAGSVVAGVPTDLAASGSELAYQRSYWQGQFGAASTPAERPRNASLRGVRATFRGGGGWRKPGPSDHAEPPLCCSIVARWPDNGQSRSPLRRGNRP